MHDVTDDSQFTERIVSPIGRWAIGMAVVVLAIVIVSYTVFGLTWAISGQDAVSDTAVGALGALALYIGLLGSLIAFVLAMVARRSPQRSALLWLPTALFPALVVIIVIVEVLWLE